MLNAKWKWSSSSSSSDSINRVPLTILQGRHCWRYIVWRTSQFSAWSTRGSKLGLHQQHQKKRIVKRWWMRKYVAINNGINHVFGQLKRRACNETTQADIWNILPVGSVVWLSAATKSSQCETAPKIARWLYRKWQSIASLLAPLVKVKWAKFWNDMTLMGRNKTTWLVVTVMKLKTAPVVKIFTAIAYGTECWDCDWPWCKKSVYERWETNT